VRFQLRKRHTTEVPGRPKRQYQSPRTEVWLRITQRGVN
jgi:hypothetical protein